MAFERFTERGKKVLTLAEEEARRSHHSYIGTEHLLLGLLGEGDGLAASVLNRLGVGIGQVRQRIESVLGRNEDIITEPIPTSHVKTVIEISYEESRRMGHNYVGTEHLLLGILIEGTGVAAHVLEDLGATLDRVRSEIERLMRDSTVKDSERAPRPPSQTPVLDRSGYDLTDQARRNRVDPVVGREIEQIIQILTRRTKNSVVVIGTRRMRAIVDSLARQIVLGNVPESLMDKRVHTLELDLLLANARARGHYRSRLQKIIREIIDEILSSREVVLVIEDLPAFIGAGRDPSAMEVAEVFKPAFIKDDIQCVGAATLEVYRDYMQPDPALDARFQSVAVDQLSADETREMVLAKKHDYELHHHVHITDKAIRVATSLSGGRPDSALELIDAASAMVQTKHASMPEHLKELHSEIGRLHAEKEEAIDQQDYEAATMVREKEKTLRERFIQEESAWRNKLGETRPDVTDEDVEAVADAFKDSRGEGSRS
jgi:ATP-dependent Clp protease ATP-binding subunit ClpC